MHSNEKREDLDEFEDEGERKNIGYILFLFIALPQKESNHSINKGKEIKSLNHLICIPKIG